MTLSVLAADLLRRADLPSDEPLVLSSEVSTWPDGTLAALIDAGVLTPASNAIRVSCQECDENHSEFVQYSESNDHPFIMCPALGRVWLDSSELQRWLITLPKFAEHLCRAARTGYTPETRRPGRDWYLGVVPVDEGRELHLVRGITWTDGQETFGALASSNRNLMITLSPAQPNWLRTEHFIPLTSLLIEKEGRLELAPDSLGAAAKQLKKPCGLLHEGHQWRIRWKGEEATLSDQLGFTYLAHLLRNPYQEISAIDLMRIAGGNEPAGESGLQPRVNALPEEQLDVPARRAYKARIAELDTKKRSSGLSPEQQHELETLQMELRHATGIGGRARRMAEPTEKARSSVTNAVLRALERIGSKQPIMAEHLRASINRGSMFCYRPTEPIDWDIQLL